VSTTISPFLKMAARTRHPPRGSSDFLTHTTKAYQV
jgi:hypothetical protein